jgi:ribonuclease-3 family protein
MAGSVNRMHSEATRYARCESQADVIRHMQSSLGDQEKDIVRRARNAKPGYIPKHAGAVDYHNATGFEALVGYLYLKNDLKRLNEILEIAFSRVGGQERGNGKNCDDTNSQEE